MIDPRRLGDLEGFRQNLDDLAPRQKVEAVSVLILGARLNNRYLDISGPTPTPERELIGRRSRIMLKRQIARPHPRDSMAVVAFELYETAVPIELSEGWHWRGRGLGHWSPEHT